MKAKMKKTKAKATARVEEVRRENVRDLIRSERTSVRRLAQQMDFTPATVYQWLSPPSSVGHRSISENMARVLEERLQLPTGSLDKAGLVATLPMDVVARRMADAEETVERVRHKVGVRLSRRAQQLATEAIARELEEGRTPTFQSVEMVVRVAARK